MAEFDEDGAATDVTAQDAIAGDPPADKSGAASGMPAADDGGAVSAVETIEHPLDIISEIEHLLRIVGNVAVHEFRRISERLADLKNHPAIKPGE